MCVWLQVLLCKYAKKVFAQANGECGWWARGKARAGQLSGWQTFMGVRLSFVCISIRCLMLSFYLKIASSTCPANKPNHLKTCTMPIDFNQFGLKRRWIWWLAGVWASYFPVESCRLLLAGKVTPDFLHCSRGAHLYLPVFFNPSSMASSKLWRKPKLRRSWELDKASPKRSPRTCSAKSHWQNLFQKSPTR